MCVELVLKTLNDSKQKKSSFSLRLFRLSLNLYFDFVVNACETFKSSNVDEIYKKKTKKMYKFLKMATCKTNCCHSDARNLLFENIKVNKKTRHVTKNALIVFTLSFCVIFETAFAQLYPQNPYLGDRDPRFYSRPGVDYKPTNPGDKDYRTYVYGNRRYGYYQPGGYGQYPGQYQPDQYPGNTGLGDDKFKFDPLNPNNPQAPFPGVLGGFREDLQGKQRRDSLLLDRDVFVTTNYGQVQGFKVHLYDNPDPNSFYRPWHQNVDHFFKKCSVFLGIPYAMPPIKSGRFKPPRVHRGWQLLQAVDFGPACPQPIQYVGATKGVRDMDEDCLYLNIYSPNTESGVAQKFPVMVYIHGGDFVRGASNLFPAHIMAAFYDTVVVTFNYRLGALGFLSTADDNSPGNYGILDMVSAIEWVYHNIDYFNGDRKSITLFGPDAGAAAAGILMVAPRTRDIVTKVIAQSGSALADQAFIIDKYRAQNTSRVFGQLVGCPIDSSFKLMNCLSESRSIYELGNAEFQPHVGLYPWGPVLDTNFTFPGDEWYDGWHEADWHFLDETPEELIRKKMFNRGLHYMTGVTTQEAAYFIYQNDSLSPRFEVDWDFMDQKIREFVLRYNYTLNLNGTYEAIKFMYTYWPDPNNKTHIRDQYVHWLSDFLIRAPTDKLVKLLVERKVPVYYYVLNTTIEAFKHPEWRKYAHDNEYFFLTGAPFMDVEFFPKKLRLERTMWTDNDRNMSHFFMKAYTNFARHGDPTKEGEILGIHFDKAIHGELRYLNVNTTFNSSILLNYRQTENAFWSEYIPSVVGVLVPTYPPSTEFWWEPKEPLQIAFWTMSIACLVLLVLLVMCCILWRNAKRESERFFDEPFAESDFNGGLDNHIVQSQPLRSQNNIYEYKDSPMKMTKSQSDFNSIRSPSSLGMTQVTQMTKISGSQSSLRSAVSLKESPSSKEYQMLDKKEKYSEREIDVRSDKSEVTDKASVISSSTTNTSTERKKDYYTSSPVPRARTPRNAKSSRTILDGGIPQTEV